MSAVKFALFITLIATLCVQANTEQAISFSQPQNNFKDNHFWRDVAAALFDELGRNHYVVAHPTKRKAQMLKTGELDISVSYRVESRVASMHFVSAPITFINTGLYASKQGQAITQIESIEQLHGKKLGIMHGYRFLNQAFWDGHRQGRLEIVEIHSAEALLKMLYSNRLDFVAHFADYTDKVIRNAGYANKITSIKTTLIPPKPVYVVVSKASRNVSQEGFVADIQRAILTLLANGSLEKIHRNSERSFEIEWYRDYLSHKNISISPQFQ